MSLVIGLKTSDDKIVMCSDSASVDTSWGDFSISGGKIIRKTPFLIGTTGDWRFNNLLHRLEFSEYEITAGRRSISANDLLYELVKKIKKLAKGADELAVTDQVARLNKDVDILVGGFGKLWHVYNDFCIVPVTRDYSAIGAGHHYAKGILSYCSLTHTLPSLTSDVPNFLRDVMTAVSHQNLYVQPPFEVEMIPREKVEGIE